MLLLTIVAIRFCRNLSMSGSFEYMNHSFFLTFFSRSGLTTVVIFMNYEGQASSQLGVKRRLISDPRKQVCMATVPTFVTRLCFMLRQFKFTTTLCLFQHHFLYFFIVSIKDAMLRHEGVWGSGGRYLLSLTLLTYSMV